MAKFFRSYKRFARKGNRKSSRGSVVKKAIRKVADKSFRKKVLSVIHKESEDKCAYGSTGNSLVMFNSGVSSSSGDVMQLVPSIAVGTADNQRIGDEIRAKSLHIKGALVMSVDAQLNVTTSKRIAVRIMVVQPKRYNCLSDIQTNYALWTAGLLKKGGTQSSFTGLLSDLWAPINTDEITKYYDKVVYMTQPYLGTNSGTTSVNTVTPVDLIKTTKFFNIKLPCRNRKLRYDPQSDNDLQPTTYNPVMLIGYTHLDGSSADIIGTQVGLTYDAMMYYEDA